MVAKAEQSTGQLRSTYEEFVNRPFYVDINRQTVALLPQVRNVVDIATGTGAIITQFIQQEKLLPGYEIKGYDIDRTSLDEARRKFGPNNRQIRFEEASAEFIHLGDNWADAVTFCNAIHLTNAQDALYEGSRILKPGKVLAVNTAYAEDLAYVGESGRTWASLVAYGKKIAREKHGISEFTKPVNLRTYTSGDYKMLAENAGFEKISIGQIVKNMEREDVAAICRYKEFTEGALPGVEYEIARDCLLEAIEPTLRRRHSDSIPRGWMVMYAFKKAA